MIKLGIANLKRNDNPELSAAAVRVITEAAAWCARKSVDGKLRSPALDPSTGLNIPKWSKDTDIEAWFEAKYESYRECVLEISTKRSSLLKEESTLPFDLPTALTTGKLLHYFPMEHVADGASEASSHGFFDGDDAPPWDTWMTYVDGAIYCYIPCDFYSVAQAGIDANPVDCIHWAEWNKMPSAIISSVHALRGR